MTHDKRGKERRRKEKIERRSEQGNEIESMWRGFVVKRVYIERRVVRALLRCLMIIVEGRIDLIRL